MIFDIYLGEFGGEGYKEFVEDPLKTKINQSATIEDINTSILQANGSQVLYFQALFSEVVKYVPLSNEQVARLNAMVSTTATCLFNITPKVLKKENPNVREAYNLYFICFSVWKRGLSE